MSVEAPGLHLTGVQAELRFGYRQAAQLGAWSLVYDRGPAENPHQLRRVLTAAVVTADPVALRGSPLVLIVARPRSSWRWPVESVEVTPAGLFALLGPKEESARVPIRQT